MLADMTSWARVLGALTLVFLVGCEGHTDAANILKSKGIAATADSLSSSATLGRVDDVKLLLKAGVHPNDRDASGNTALIQAAWHGRDAVALALLEAGADPNLTVPLDGLTPMLAAAGQGHVSIIPILASKGGNPNAPDKGGATALMHAAFSGNVALVKALLKAGADPTLGPSKQNAIDIARGRGNIEIVDLLTGQAPKSQ